MSKETFLTETTLRDQVAVTVLMEMMRWQSSGTRDERRTQAISDALDFGDEFVAARSARDDAVAAANAAEAAVEPGATTTPTPEATTTPAASTTP